MIEYPLGARNAARHVVMFLSCSQAKIFFSRGLGSVLSHEGSDVTVSKAKLSKNEVRKGSFLLEEERVELFEGEGTPWVLGVVCVLGSHEISVSWITMFKPCTY